MHRKIVIAAFTCFVAFPAAAAEIEVTQADKDFSVHEITASAGDAIVFKNNDSVAHNVHSSTSGHRFDLGLQKPGSSARLELPDPGDFTIRCAIHPKMKVQISVK